MTQRIDFVQESAAGIIESVFHSAVENRASDIHFDPGRTSLHIRFRIDGILYAFKDYSNTQKDEILSRVKVLAQIDITDKRLPHDGHIEFTYKNKIYNLRVSTVPTTHGDALALRVFNKDSVLSKLDTLGFDEQQLKILKNVIHSPHGLTLITGPTGSGKTTLC